MISVYLSIYLYLSHTHTYQIILERVGKLDVAGVYNAVGVEKFLKFVLWYHAIQEKICYWVRGVTPPKVARATRNPTPAAPALQGEYAGKPKPLQADVRHRPGRHQPLFYQFGRVGRD